MKFSIINATVLCFAALSIAAPLMNADDISDLVERNAAAKAAKKVQGGKPRPSLSVPQEGQEHRRHRRPLRGTPCTYDFSDVHLNGCFRSTSKLLKAAVKVQGGRK
ncbi:hypothetical protein NLJ89_g7991 [Agrocybe chaxingu]|uniref:Uncharacterized protein n=1 Tax=Agrocybe chaxingu TaxID=84603 RepID=A0A9W8JV93_9AGAR|nr:hypothetical protein NLJ89_g7991 [Agrocybe chaxingu]